MSHFNKIFIRILAGIFIAQLSLSAISAEWTLAELMTLLSQNKSGKATFVEKKYIGIIDSPIESSGELSFNYPDKLEKRTIKPRPESLLLDGDRLTLVRLEKRALTINLQDHPEVATVVESIRGTLMGNLAALEKGFQIELTGSAAHWRLVLTPTDISVANKVRRISIRGVDSDIRTIDFEQLDGDHSEMQISKVISQ